jgi:arsenite methyltransferase
LGHERLQILRGSVSSLPFADRRFDCALTVHAIYFWPDPGEGLREIHRVLKPGGRLLIASECPEDLGRRAYARHGFRIYRDGELAGLLREAGFADVTVEREGHRVFGSAVFTAGRS